MSANLIFKTFKTANLRWQQFQLKSIKQYEKEGKKVMAKGYSYDLRA